MAWHSGKPADGDFLSVSVQHIRENFAELEPLQPHVAEIVELTALQPHVSDLVDLTALQPHVSDLVDLTALQPHVAVLLDSRIVEMGSNSNGEYVRWENGLQICMVQRLLLGFFNPNHLFVDWTLPAAFVAADYVPIALYDFDEGVDTSAYFVKSLHARNKSTTSVRIDLFSSGMFTSSDIRRVSVLAIGRWK